MLTLVYLEMKHVIPSKTGSLLCTDGAEVRHFVAVRHCLWRRLEKGGWIVGFIVGSVAADCPVMSSMSARSNGKTWKHIPLPPAAWQPACSCHAAVLAVSDTHIQPAARAHTQIIFFRNATLGMRHTVVLCSVNISHHTPWKKGALVGFEGF